MNELTYMTVDEIRQEILIEVGVYPGDRFTANDQRGIRKENLLMVVAELRPPGELYDFAEMRLGRLYELLGVWVGVEHEHTAGNDWTMNRDLLKALHRALHEQ